MFPIKWNRLTRAFTFYHKNGFEPFEVDWHVPLEIARLTYAGPSHEFEDGVLIGSAEQGFMYAQRQGLLEDKNYVSISPCFRKEDVQSEIHQKYFMKLELYSPNKKNEDTDLKFAQLARKFMEQETSHDVSLVSTDEGYDLEINGIEVGSYMSRSVGGMDWTCGTGLAEPRFSMALKAQK